MIVKPTLKRRVIVPVISKRSHNPSIRFPVIIIDGKKYCRYCSGSLPKGRSAWCSDKCMDDAMIECLPSFARHAVGRRDHGICATCGKDTVKLQKEYYHTYQLLRKNHQYTIAKEFLNNKKLEGWPIDEYNSRSWWEAHHIIPVVEGGGGCGLDNYETICVPCHKKETATLRKRLSKAKK